MEAAEGTEDLGTDMEKNLKQKKVELLLQERGDNFIKGAETGLCLDLCLRKLY